MAVRARYRAEASVTPAVGNAPRGELTAGPPRRARRRLGSIAAAVACAALLAACASQPAPPDWALDAKAALDRATAAWLEGRSRVAEQEFARGLEAVSRTGRIELIARAELLRCAARVASLVFDDCPGFERLRIDAPAAERSYADHLSGRAVAEVALLPPAQQQVARLAADAPAGATDAALAAIADPLSRLVAAGVLLRRGKATPTTLETAVAAASQQGWRRPLLAWLGAQALRAERAGAGDEAARIRRRIALTEAGGAPR